jgi:hypothetical protein
MGEVVGGLVHVAPGQKRPDMVQKQRRVEGVGVVVVLRRPLLIAQVREIAVVGVLLQDQNGCGAESLMDARSDQGLARGRPTGDPDEDSALRIGDLLVHEPSIPDTSSTMPTITVRTGPRGRART